jgi:hypothetical protein
LFFSALSMSPRMVESEKTERQALSPNEVP